VPSKSTQKRPRGWEAYYYKPTSLVCKPKAHKNRIKSEKKVLRNESVNPLVSIIIPTFNHENFIGRAIESALAQTYKPIEIIVVNDGSQDKTESEVSRFLKFGIKFVNQNNEGVSAAVNNGFRIATGDYIAFQSGDDCSRPERIATQIKALRDQKVATVFSAVELIDESGTPLRSKSWATGLFETFQGDRSAVLRKLFCDGNFLNASSALISREALETVREPMSGNLFNPHLLQLQDFDLWCRLVSKFDLVILKEPLVYYRILNNHRNLSAPKVSAHRRAENERLMMFRNFFDPIDDQLFRTAFGELLTNRNFTTPQERKVEEALLFLSSKFAPLAAIGVENAHQLIANGVPEHYSGVLKQQLECVLSERDIFFRQQGYFSKVLSRLKRAVRKIKKS